MYFICPVCKGELQKKDNSVVCSNGHCFDCAKSGYVNLLINASNSKNHGDNKFMTKARRDFLNKGYYSPLKDKLIETAKDYVKSDDMLLDCGCGEGYYTSLIYESLQNTKNSIKTDNRKGCPYDCNYVFNMKIRTGIKACPFHYFAIRFLKA